MTPRPVRRRSVLGLLAAVATTPALGGMPRCPEATLRRICGRAARHPDLAALGRTWRERHPETPATAWLADLARGLPDRDEAGVVEILRARAMSDFREGRIVDLDGWRVSETEARLCAVGVSDA